MNVCAVKMGATQEVGGLVDRCLPVLVRHERTGGCGPSLVHRDAQARPAVEAVLSGDGELCGRQRRPGRYGLKPSDAFSFSGDGGPVDARQR